MLCNLLDVQTVFANIGYVLLTILLFLLMITVHEAGHFLVGKLLGFKITEFAIGFGPALIKKTLKNGQLFTLRAIPFGGYCAFSGEAEEQEKTEKKEGNAPLDEVFPDMGKTSQNGETGNFSATTESVAASGKPVKEKRKWAENGDFYQMHPFKRILVLFAGATMNYLLALVFIFLSFGIFGQLMPGVVQVEEAEGIEQEYCLQNGDIFFAAEGRQVYTYVDLITALKDKNAGDRVEMTVSRIFTDGETKHREMTTISLQLRCATNFENSTDTYRLWSALGIAKQTSQSGEVVVDSEGNVTFMVASYRYRGDFLTTVGRGFVYSFRIAGTIFRLLGELLTGSISLTSLSGPVSTIAMTMQVVSRGVQPFLEIAAYIGVNLAVMNLLPIPSLDGSKIVFTAVEWIRGKPIDRKIENAVHLLGILFLIGIALLVDLLHLL